MERAKLEWREPRSSNGLGSFASVAAKPFYFPPRALMGAFHRKCGPVGDTCPLLVDGRYVPQDNGEAVPVVQGVCSSRPTTQLRAVEPVLIMLHRPSCLITHRFPNPHRCGESGECSKVRVRGQRRLGIFATATDGLVWG